MELIPRANEDHSNYPCWVHTKHQTNNKEWFEAYQRGEEIEKIYETVKPSIICKCGKYCGIGLHHVHADGTVTASFFDRDLHKENDNLGCQWHVFLQLADYNDGEFLPKQQ